ncbi:MAG: hypothetical protein DMG75_00920, partial [Acidobacteria bacterium]
IQKGGLRDWQHTGGDHTRRTSGGSISFELGGLSRDTVELRDGTVLLGDVVSLSMTAVVVRMDGSDRTYDRNRIKKLMLVEREITQRPPLTQPVPAQPKQ